MADEFKACSVEGCNGNSHYSSQGAKGFCRRHYKRLLRHGDALGGSTGWAECISFYRDVLLTYDGDGCLRWPYGRTQAGYATTFRDGKRGVVSRFLCEDTYGPPPTPEHQAAHSCGNGHLGCVTKGHLSWKTPVENQADRLIHGTDGRGERHSQAKLTEDNVREIISQRGKGTCAEIAMRYNVSRKTISDIHNGKTWSWLQE